MARHGGAPRGAWGAAVVVALCALAAVPVAGQTAGDIVRVDTLPPAFYGLDARPNWNAMGRLYVHGPTGNVAVGDISKYNDTSAPTQRLEVDGTSLLHGSVVFNNRNGESELVVLENNPTSLTVKDTDLNKYIVINTDTDRTELQRPLHVIDTNIYAVDNTAAGLVMGADASTPMLTFDTTDAAENLKSAFPINVIDTTDTCATTDASCSAKASVVTAGGLTVAKKSFLTGTVKVADTQDMSVGVGDAVDASVTLAGGLAVTKSAVVKGKVQILDSSDGQESGAGALYVRGGVSSGGEMYVGKTLDVEGNTDIGGKLSVFYGLAVAKEAQFGAVSTFADTTDATSAESAAVVIRGGLGVGMAVRTGGSVAVLDTTEAVDTNTAALMSFGGLAVQKDVRSGGTVYAKAFATNSGQDQSFASGAALDISSAASEQLAVKQGGSDRVVVSSAGDVAITAATGRTSTMGGSSNNVVTSKASYTTTVSQGEGANGVGSVVLSDDGILIESADRKPISIVAGGKVTVSSTSGEDATVSSSADLHLNAQSVASLRAGGYAIIQGDRSTGAVVVDSVRSGSARTTTVKGDGLTLTGDLGGTVVAGNGIALTSCGSFYGATQCGDVSIGGNSVNVAATDTQSSVSVTALAAGGSFYGISQDELFMHSYSGSDTGVRLIAGRENPGYLKMQQEEYSASLGTYYQSTRLEVAASGKVTITSSNGQPVTIASEDSVPVVNSLNARRTSLSKTVTITDSAASPATVTTVRLAAGKSAVLKLSLHATLPSSLGSLPAFFHGEFFVSHHSGAAPEPSASTTPKRTGLRSATSHVGDADDAGVFEVVVAPDDSGGAGVTKDFHVKVYVASGSSGFTAPSTLSVTATAQVDGVYESLS